MNKFYKILLLVMLCVQGAQASDREHVPLRPPYKITQTGCIVAAVVASGGFLINRLTRNESRKLDSSIDVSCAVLEKIKEESERPTRALVLMQSLPVFESVDGPLTPLAEMLIASPVQVPLDKAGATTTMFFPSPEQVAFDKSCATTVKERLEIERRMRLDRDITNVILIAGGLSLGYYIITKEAEFKQLTSHFNQMVPLFNKILDLRGWHMKKMK